MKYLNYIRSSFIFMTLTLVSHLLFASECENLRDELFVSYPSGFSTSTIAGTPIEFSTQIMSPASNVLSKFEKIELVYTLMSSWGNEPYGPRGKIVIDKDYNLPKVGAIATTEKMFGFYKLNFMVRTASPYCWLFLEPPVQGVVVENSGMIDMNPPRISEVKVSKPVIRKGEVVSIEFIAEDKSKICTISEFSQGECHTDEYGILSWIDFERPDGKVSQVFYSTFFERTSRGRYLVSFPTDSEWVKGTYKILKIQISDIWGNTNKQKLEPTVSVSIK